MGADQQRKAGKMEPRQPIQAIVYGKANVDKKKLHPMYQVSRMANHQAEYTIVDDGNQTYIQKPA